MLTHFLIYRHYLINIFNIFSDSKKKYIYIHVINILHIEY